MTQTPLTHVFLGPSLSWDEARAILPQARLLPPAAAGDVYLAVQNGARRIGIVDGVFERVPAVWHKEVLYALSHGVHVYGASSMGALRAAELHPFGMIGVGRIFEDYRDGHCEDDDDVAVQHGPAEVGFVVVTEAMVNVRDALVQALRRGLVSRTTHDTVVRGMKLRHYMQRSWAALDEIAAAANLPDGEVAALQAFVRDERPNLKRSDAIELLRRLRDDERDGAAAFVPGFEFERTVFWEQLVAAKRIAPGARAATPDADARLSIGALRSHVGFVEPDADVVFEGALLLYLIVKEAQRLGLTIDAERFEAAGGRLMRALDLHSAADLAAWQRRNGLGLAEFTGLVELTALIHAVSRHHATGLDAFLPAQLQRSGRYEAVAAALHGKHRVLADLGMDAPSASDVGTTIEKMLTWYEQRYRPVGESLEEHSQERGFGTPAQFVRELLVQYVLHRDPGPGRGVS